MPSHSRKYTKIPVLLRLKMDLRMLAIFVVQGFNDASTKFLSKDVPRQQFASLYCFRDTVFSFILFNLISLILSPLSYTNWHNSKYVNIIFIAMYIPVYIPSNQRKNLCLNLDCRKNNFWKFMTPRFGVHY